MRAENDLPAVAALEAEAPPRPAVDRKPWHAPTLTQVVLNMTALNSGPFVDGLAETSTDPNP